MRLASFCLFMIVAGSIGLVSHAIAGPTRVSPGGPGNTTEPVISGNGAPASTNFGAQTAPTNSASNSTSNSSSSAGNSGDSGSADENPNVAGYGADGLPILRAKPGREHEKVIQLKDGQKLPTSGVDPKFQGSLLNTSVDSIVSVSPQADKNRGAGNKEPGSKKSDLSVTKESSDSQKKNGSSSARSDADSSPSPSPSATASPATKTSSDRKP
jgi:hypothetical protein